ncbi:hypothetical protein [Fredinandcohnia onubensis]|uniref:hypothetical protein n=1 Tax=Fredinandcohnia onubensis TaxID=1571209 RepID=UPI000C0C0906|nr:hypothetical protein [Fredinandcohnia onubensis]
MLKISKINTSFKNYEELINYLISNNSGLKNYENVLELIRQNFEFTFIVHSDFDNKTEDKDTTIVVLNRFLRKVFDIPKSQQYIFKWENIEYKIGSHYLVETNGDSCSFLIIDALEGKYLIVPTL